MGICCSVLLNNIYQLNVVKDVKKEEISVFLLCYKLAFLITYFFPFTVLTSCLVSFRQFAHWDSVWVFITLATYVIIFSAFSENSFSCESCFCVSAFVVIMTYHGSVLVLVYSVIWWLSGDVDFSWLFLHVECNKYCRSVRVP